MILCSNGDFVSFTEDHLNQSNLLSTTQYLILLPNKQNFSSVLYKHLKVHYDGTPAKFAIVKENY